MANGISISGGGGAGFSPNPPESTVQGNGSYTIPAGKYGHISMSAGCSSLGYVRGSGDGGSGGGSGSSNTAIVSQGDTIGTSNSFPSSSSSLANTAASVHGYASVTINGTRACIAHSGSGCGGSQSNPNFVLASSSGSAGWSVALFNI